MLCLIPHLLICFDPKCQFESPSSISHHTSIMSAVKAAAAHIDWTKLSTSLGLKTETVAALSAFRKRNEEARRVLTDLKEQKTAVDFAHYRKVLKNQAVVGEVEKAFTAFKPTSYDVKAQIK